MLDRLALLAQRRGRRVIVAAVVFAVAAGALGAGVADRLDPYGADDPATESVKAADRLQDAGYRETGVIVLINPSRSTRRPAAGGSTRSPSAFAPTVT